MRTLIEIDRFRLEANFLLHDGIRELVNFAKMLIHSLHASMQESNQCSWPENLAKIARFIDAMLSNQAYVFFPFSLGVPYVNMKTGTQRPQENVPKTRGPRKRTSMNIDSDRGIV